MAGIAELMCFGVSLDRILVNAFDRLIKSEH